MQILLLVEKRFRIGNAINAKIQKVQAPGLQLHGHPLVFGVENAIRGQIESGLIRSRFAHRNQAEQANQDHQESMPRSRKSVHG